MFCLIKLMRVKDKDERGNVLEYDGRVYFIDKKDENSNKYDIGEYVPVIIVKELDKYGFVVTAESLSDLFSDIISEPTRNLNNLYSIILNKEGYINNINNIITAINTVFKTDDTVFKTNLEILPVSEQVNTLLSEVYKNTDKVTLNSVYGTKDPKNIYTKFVYMIKVLYTVNKYYRELYYYKHS